MRTSTIVWLVIIIIVLGGGWWWFTQPTTPAAGGPSTAAGINGSPNQGNLGQPDTGTPQQPDTGLGDASSPSGDGTSVSQNLILGTSNTASLGSFLTAYNGMTLYRYTKDGANVSNCTGTCAANWPPYTVSSAADINVPSTFAKADVGTITRADGSLQVTYKKQPLYFYVKDAKPGDTVGQGVGGVWFVVKP